MPRGGPTKPRSPRGENQQTAVRRDRCGCVPREFRWHSSKRNGARISQWVWESRNKWWASKRRSTRKWMESQGAQERAIPSPAHRGLCQLPRGLHLGLLQRNSAAGGPASLLGPHAESACWAEGKPATGKANRAQDPDTVSVLPPHSLFRTPVLQRQPTNPHGNQYHALPGE